MLMQALYGFSGKVLLKQNTKNKNGFIRKTNEWRIIDEETVKETNDMSVSSGNGTVFPYGIPGWHIWNTWYGTDSTCGNNHTVEAGR